MSGSAISHVVVVGGGITGSVHALALARRGVSVTLVEISPVWSGIGHGITIQGNALNAFREVGVLDDVLAIGAPFDQLRMLHADGSLIAEIDTPRTGGADLPATLGALRRDLQAVLCQAVYAAGVTVRLGTTVTGFLEREDGIDVSLADGSELRADLLVGADGIRSSVRRMLGIDVAPSPVGMGIWRVVAPRPAGLDCAEVYYGGLKYKAGYSPISADRCYAYVLEGNLDRRYVGERAAGGELRERAAGYGGHWATIRDGLADDTVVNYQWIESILVTEPWYRGRVVVIGDAVHACPPLIAQGAAMCAEDAVVLAEMLVGGSNLPDTLAAFMARRMPRVGMVLANSMQLATWEMFPQTPGADPGRVVGHTLSALQAPP